MSSQKLWKIPIWSVPLFVAHGIEEYLTFSYTSIPTFVTVGKTFQVSAQTGFLIFELVVWSVLLISIYFIQKRVPIFSQLAVLGWAGVYLIQTEHIINALRMGSYYAGLITSIPILILGFLFWKELLRVFIRKH